MCCARFREPNLDTGSRARNTADAYWPVKTIGQTFYDGQADAMTDNISIVTPVIRFEYFIDLLL